MYNATVTGYDTAGTARVHGTAQVDQDGNVVAYNGLQVFDGTRGTREYHRRHWVRVVEQHRGLGIVRHEITRDGCAGYRDRLAGLMLPPSYTG